MNAWIGIACVLAALGLLVVAVRRAQAAGRLGAESARKAVHVGMGLVCLSFPWVFTDVWPVWALAGLAAVALGALRYVRALRVALGPVLHAVERASWGEVYFPLGVALVFTLAQGHRLAFVIPVALLAFADAAGALVGRSYGRHRYATLEGTKSVEGSAAVGVVAGACALVPLLAAGHAWAESLLIGLVVGVFALLVEAISWRGLDNVFLPLSAFAQVTIYLGQSATVLAGRLAVLVGLTVVAWMWRRGRIVDESARLGGALALYFFWSVGGWLWLIAPVALLTAYVRLMPTVPGGVPQHNLVAVICVGSAGLVWAVAEAMAPGGTWWWCFTLGIATQQAIIATVRFSQGRAHWPRVAWWGIGLGQAWVVQLPLFLLAARGQAPSWTQLGVGAGSMVAATGLFVLSERRLQMPDDLTLRWWKQGVAAVLASLGGLYV